MTQGERSGVAKNETPHGPLAPQQGAVTQTDLLTLYGIKAVPGISYEWGAYRYTNATDAISAAKRGASE
jgi:hypothetical protein